MLLTSTIPNNLTLWFFAATILIQLFIYLLFILALIVHLLSNIIYEGHQKPIKTSRMREKDIGKSEKVQKQNLRAKSEGRQSRKCKPLELL